MKEGRRQAWSRLARDVGVNVLANLLAVPILYLIGVLAGLFPKNPRAIAASLVFILLVSVFVLVLVSRFLEQRGWLRLTSLAFGAFGLALVIGGIADIDMQTHFPRWVNITWGALTITICFFSLLFARPRPDSAPEKE